MISNKDFNDMWAYKKQAWNEIDVAGKLEALEQINLPHTWYADNDYYQGEGVYQKVFNYDKKANQRTFVKFHGVDRECQVFLNGVKLGEHKGGYTAFTLELTEALNAGENILTVLVSNGKSTTVSPLSGDFAVFGGIHRKVELIETDSDCFDRTYFGCDGVIFQTRVNEKGNGELWAKAVVSGNQNASIVYTIEGSCDSVYKVDGADTLKKVCEIENPTLWNGVDDTKLYTAKATLIVDGKEVDCVKKQVGFRKIAVDSNKGFFLNDEHVKLHGVAKHQDTAGVFSAATMENWKTDMELIHEIGANAVRLSHYPHPQEVYSLCDEIGFVVWAEIPLLKLTEDEELFENAKNQLKEMILQNIHHPSICFWGIVRLMASIFAGCHFESTISNLTCISPTWPLATSKPAEERDA